MWISQTYLGSVGKDADVYIYYFWEDYAPQPGVNESVLRNLSDLGYSFREKVSVFVPQPGYLGLIREEMRAKFEIFWREFSGKTPGLFFITQPLDLFDPTRDEWLFLPMQEKLISNESDLLLFFQELHRKCEEVIEYNYQKTRPEPWKLGSSGLLKALYDSLQLKFSVAGFGVDLKPLISHLQRRIR
jgi:hypothetical protein